MFEVLTITNECYEWEKWSNVLKQWRILENCNFNVRNGIQFAHSTSSVLAQFLNFVQEKYRDLGSLSSRYSRDFSLHFNLFAARVLSESKNERHLDESFCLN